ncbi:MAG: ComF family protein [Calditrichaeota bacterium]|nr:ComF family protein [Calditrichota bacterium]
MLSFIAPVVCLVCEEPLSSGAKIVCEECYCKIPRIDKSFVKKLKEEIPNPNFDDLIVRFEFDPVFQKLIHLLKYERFTSIARLFGQSLAEFIPLEFDLVTAVPLNPVRLKERGYNQSALIAEHLSEITRIPFDDTILQRIRNTQTQTKLSRAERQQNVKEAFIVTGKVKGKRILLIDDVITTGSTLNECAHVLKAAGSDRITIAAIATPVDFLQSDATDNLASALPFQI